MIETTGKYGCVVCGAEHPRGLRLRFEIGPDGSAGASWTPGEEWEGYAGVVHGGIVATLLDEAMAKAVAAVRRRAVTGELNVRFRRPVASGEEIRIRGWVVEKRQRLFRAEASITGGDGIERAHAWATFVAQAESEPRP